jgi:hypothetical protein
LSEPRDHPKTDSITVKISKEDLQVLERVCQDRGESVGAFVRMATLKELAALGAFDASRAKSLGVKVVDIVDLSTGRVEANRTGI